MSTSKKMVFVCGCPRSGTTAMWRLLTASSKIILGVERFGLRVFTPKSLTPDLFEEDRFFSVKEGDTFYSELESFNGYYKDLREKYDLAEMIGDKIPKLYTRLPHIANHFPNAKIVFMFRNVIDVAASYQRRAENPEDHTWRRDQGVTEAVRDWAMSLNTYRNRPANLNILPICYEDLFVNGLGLAELLTFLEIPNGSEMQVRFKNLMARSEELEQARDRGLSINDLMHICEKAPFGAYRTVLEEAREARISIGQRG